MKDWSPKLWLRILLPTVLILVWLAIAGVGGPTFGKISSVSTNDQAGFLPASAESTAVSRSRSSTGVPSGSSAPACLPNSQNSSSSTPVNFFPPTVSFSAAMTFSAPPFPRCVMVLMWSCTWNRSDSSSSFRIMSRAG